MSVLKTFPAPALGLNATVFVAVREFSGDTSSFSVSDVSDASLCALGVVGNVSFTATALEIDQKSRHLGWSRFSGSDCFPDAVSVELYTPSRSVELQLECFFFFFMIPGLR